MIANPRDSTDIQMNALMESLQTELRAKDETEAEAGAQTRHQLTANTAEVWNIKAKEEIEELMPDIIDFSSAVTAETIAI